MTVTTRIVLIIVGVFGLLAIVRAVFAHYGSEFLSSIDSWQTYFRGPGVLQLVFLIMGAVGAWASVYYAPSLKNLSIGEVKQYRGVDPNKPVLRQEDIHNYSHLTVFARTQEPAGSSAKLTIFRNGGSEAPDMKPMEITSPLWNQLDLPNNYANMSLIVEPSAKTDAVQATQVDVLIYLRAK